ncbi:unnamed protein product [Trichogramma brassicae]|uniref:DENR N-terminal domain-containing protein n=1 Tax=Trichogramma brassicae TaxID=86971 RepID=A0A6H5HWI9_9HYME|nr:unnamed protein product [Trichogramma brassicae]
MTTEEPKPLRELRLGANPNVNHPIKYCEYYPDYQKCKEWLEKFLPSEFVKVKLDKKRQKRGGKGMLKTKKNGECNTGEDEIVIQGDVKDDVLDVIPQRNGLR